MTIFASWQSYQHFTSAVCHQLRYARTSQTDDFLKAVLATSHNRQKYVEKGAILWRAQLGSAWHKEGEGDEAYEVPCAYEPARMTPLRDRASDGRVNPRGIPCLYLANRKETAIAEVRPWIGSYVSVAQFEVVRRLKIINCACYHDRTPTIYLNFVKGDAFGFYEPDPAKREEAVWIDIDRALSEPMTRSDDAADYVPTQIIAEHFKSNGFDGIAYASKFGGGLNLAIFDLDAAKLHNCSLYQVNSVTLESSEQCNPYFVRTSDQS